MTTNKPKRSTKARKVKHSAAKVTATGLSDALFSGTQQRVLGLLFGQPERSFFATELINLAASGSGAVQRELSRLTASGLVRTTNMGKQKHYQANPAAPVFEELRSIVMKTSGLAEPLRAALMPLAGHIQFAAVYGSVAKSTDRAASDIDLLVVADELSLEQLFTALAPMEKQLGRTINPTLYTASEFLRRRKSGNVFLEKVLAGRHIVLTGSEHAIGSTG